MQPINSDEILDKILTSDSRYHRDAYLFVRESLDHTQKLITKPAKNEIRHVTGKELLEGIREYGLAQFGPMVLTVFNEWGIHRCEDFGEIVFNMVEHKLLSKTEADTRNDFKDAYDFIEAFRRPFQPAQKKSAPTPESKPSKV